MAEQMSLFGTPKQLAQANQSTTSTTGPGQMAPAPLLQNQLYSGFSGQPFYSGTTIPVTTTGSLGQYIGPISYPSYPTVSVPIYNYDSKEGILLTDKEGKQHFVPIRDIAQTIGLEW